MRMEERWMAQYALKAPCAQLPDPFIRPDGTRLNRPEEWPAQRAYWKKMLQDMLYGTIPPPPGNTKGEVVETQAAFGGAALRQTVRITCGPQGEIALQAKILRPNRPGRFPAVSRTAFGRQAPSPDEEKAIARGYVLAEYSCFDLAPDSGMENRAITKEEFAACPLAKAYPGYTWKAIAMWAWGHSRVADYLCTTDYVDAQKLVTTGCSRAGKVALCAAANDERFAICAISASGCGGGGCFRFMGGRMGEGTGLYESLGDMIRPSKFWFWFLEELGAAYGDQQGTRALGREDYLPFDLHIARALVAPRPAITTEALDDIYANPYGTYVTWRAAEEVYRFLGAGGKNAIHYREGGHGFTAQDAGVMLDFFDNIFFEKGIAAAYKTVAPGEDPLSPALHFAWRAPQL